MYIESVPNRKSPPAVLLRESYRVDGKVKKRTLANLSMLPPDVVAGLRTLLKGGHAVDGSLGDSFDIIRSKPHGHVAAALGMLRKLGVHRLISPKGSRKRHLVEAMIVSRICSPGSKLATARGLRQRTLDSSLGELLNLEAATEDDLYGAMDFLLGKQERIEELLAARHLQNGALVLYDVSSSYFEGRTCELAAFGHNRDKKQGKMQVVYGLLCDADGRPIAVEAFAGNTADPATVGNQVEKLRNRFGLSQVIMVGDRGMLTSARIREDLRPAGIDWISSLRSPQIRGLVDAGAIQLSLFDERDLAEVTHPDFPGERLIACRNPLLAAERARKRSALLDRLESKLTAVATATSRRIRPLTGADKIGIRVGRVLETSKVAKHFDIEITESGFQFSRNQGRIDAEASLDGIYVIRTSVVADTLSSEQTVAAYKQLAHVESAFRSLKTVDLKVRPIHHRKADRVRAHILLCTLAYYVEWHMRQALAPLLFDDDDTEAAKAQRTSTVEPARRSASATAKAATKRNSENLPVHSFQTLLADLATITRNVIQPRAVAASTFTRVTSPTPLQQKALQLLGCSLMM